MFLLVAAFALALGVMAVQLSRLKRERDERQAKIDELLAALSRPAAVQAGAVDRSMAGRLEELEGRLARLEASRRVEIFETPPAVPQRPAAPPPAQPAEPGAVVYVYVAMGFARRGLCAEAVRSLEEALRLDASVFWRTRPRSLLGSEEEYQKVLEELQRRVRENPLDVEARVVLAYLCVHDPALGRDQAKALLVQALGLDPGHAVAKRLLEGLEQ